MLYLIESGDYYKIGTTTDIKRRMQDYRTHNPNVELIDLCEGYEAEEKVLHNRLKKFWVKNEWFKKDPEILEVWEFYKSIRTAFEQSAKMRPDYLNMTKEDVEKLKDENFKLMKSNNEYVDLLKQSIENFNECKNLFDVSCSIVQKISNKNNIKQLSIEERAFIKIKTGIDITEE